ncbi:hypothetical protein CLOSTMETH_00780 [[Clostridium] methylpentosum DSM 5476]|uniref:Uncharacterized protein n=1 Tax=[Clostridium] methylpentosum DSM 5476 TaxID=537013 RepID=C0EAC6_9FIRM|nr:hypothetical protein CLOSTMETH_00780 [[Clostridium] methylpentosum DSM 5476]
MQSKNFKSRASGLKVSGGSPASAHEKPLFHHFVENTSMKNQFGFWALKNPQTCLNTKKNRSVI